MRVAPEAVGQVGQFKVHDREAPASDGVGPWTMEEGRSSYLRIKLQVHGNLKSC